MQLPAKLSRYAAVATLLLKHRSAMDDHAGDARSSSPRIGKGSG